MAGFHFACNEYQLEICNIFYLVGHLNKDVLQATHTTANKEKILTFSLKLI